MNTALRGTKRRTTQKGFFTMRHGLREYARRSLRFALLELMWQRENLCGPRLQSLCGNRQSL